MKSPADLTLVITAKTLWIAQPIRMALRGMGFRSIHVGLTHQQTLEVFQTAAPDALIAYVDNAENDDGLDLIRLIRRSDKSPNIRLPIVAASPRAELPVVSAVINAGGNEFVLLPASGDTLTKKINSAINTVRPFIETADYVGPCRRRRAMPNYAGPERRVAVKADAPAA